jgi:hypothetical protein
LRRKSCREPENPDLLGITALLSFAAIRSFLRLTRTKQPKMQMGKRKTRRTKKMKKKTEKEKRRCAKSR